MGRHLDHWDRAFEKHCTILHFLDFLQVEHGLYLNYENAKEGTPTTDKELADKFLGVDAVALEKERRGLLESLG